MKQNRTGAFIAECRRKQNWTQSDLADRLGVTDKAVSRWETGKGYPEVTILPRLAEVLGVTVSEILAGELIPEDAQTERAERALLEHLEKTRDRMYIGAGLSFVLGFMSLILGLNLWRAFGYGSDAFHGFWAVMKDGGFGLFSELLILLIPVISMVLAGYMLYRADHPKK